jgi:hypothetical protein
VHADDILRGGNLRLTTRSTKVDTSLGQISRTQTMSLDWRTGLREHGFT